MVGVYLSLIHLIGVTASNYSGREVKRVVCRLPLEQGAGMYVIKTKGSRQNVVQSNGILVKKCVSLWTILFLEGLEPVAEFRTLVGFGNTGF